MKKQGLPILLAMVILATVSAWPSGPAPEGPKQGEEAARPAPPGGEPAPHRFWDRTNVGLFAGVSAIRALDYASTRHFRGLGHEEGLLSNWIVDKKPLFATIEAAGIAASIGLAYGLHRTGHHKLERWTSILHIGVGGFGDVRNYNLARPPPRAPVP